MNLGFLRSVLSRDSDLRVRIYPEYLQVRKEVGSNEEGIALVLDCKFEWIANKLQRCAKRLTKRIASAFLGISEVCICHNGEPFLSMEIELSSSSH